MQIPDILNELTLKRGVFPRHALQEAVGRREEITPELLRILREAGEDIDKIVRQEDYMTHIYLVEEDFIDLEFVQEKLARGKERVLQELRRDRHNRFIRDVVREMEWWACFQPAPAAPTWKPTPSLPGATRKPGWPPVMPTQRPWPPIQAKKKVGRNDPCPCGSGKKYKKCCGA